MRQYNLPILFVSKACGISDEDEKTYIITGGQWTSKTVSIYSQTGWLDDLPNLVTGRHYHACGTYVDSNNNRVSTKYKRGQQSVYSGPKQ